jgi:hypothetical protein
LAEDSGHQVVVTDRGAAERDDEIRLARRLQRRQQAVAVVARDRAAQGLRPGGGQHCGQSDIVGRDDLVGSGGLARLDQFVAGGDQRHHRAAADRDAGHVHRRQQGGLATGEAARRGQAVAFSEIHACGADIGPGGGGLGDLDGVTLAPGVFLDQDGVGAVGHRGAGKDADRLALADGAAMAAAGRRLTGDGEPGAGEGVRGADRVAVHGRGGEGRLVAGGERVGGQNPAGGVGQRDFLGAGGIDQSEDAGEGVGDWEQHYSASNAPDLPPALWVTRMSVIRMARSTALHMS